MMKEDCSNIVEMTIQCEETSSGLVRPDFDLVIIPTRDEQGLRLVKVDASDWPIMFLESVNQCAHTIVP